MHNDVTLNELYADYAAGSLKKNELEAAIFKKIREDICRENPPGWTREDYDDFISWLYFRLGRAISSYRETGSSFEAYISVLIRLTSREYRARQIRNTTAESAAWITHLSEMNVCEEAPQYDDVIPYEIDISTAMSEILKTPRQLLIVILKCCRDISADFLEMISPTLGIEPETLNKMVGRLKELRGKREAEANLLRERVNSQFYRCILYEKNLKSMVERGNYSGRLEARLQRGRTRLTKMRKQLSRMHLAPSNCQIAELLGISKGTVDSVLYNVRARWLNNQR